MASTCSDCYWPQGLFLPGDAAMNLYGGGGACILYSVHSTLCAAVSGRSVAPLSDRACPRQAECPTLGLRLSSASHQSNRLSIPGWRLFHSRAQPTHKTSSSDHAARRCVGCPALDRLAPLEPRSFFDLCPSPKKPLSPSSLHFPQPHGFPQAQEQQITRAIAVAVTRAWSIRARNRRATAAPVYFARFIRVLSVGLDHPPLRARLLGIPRLLSPSSSVSLVYSKDTAAPSFLSSLAFSSAPCGILFLAVRRGQVALHWSSTDSVRTSAAMAITSHSTASSVQMV